MLIRSSGKDARLFRDLVKHKIIYFSINLKFYNSKDGSIPLFYDIEALNYNVCKELLTSHVDEQLKAKTNVDKNTAIHLACISKDIEIIKLLVENEADINIVNVIII